MRMFRFLITAVLLTGLAAAQGTGVKKEEPKQVSSFDVNALDKSADPCVNFYQYSCGGWLKNNPIPSDQAAWGRFNELAERNRSLMRDILENAAKATNRTPNEQKIGDYYATCMDEDAINKKGVAAIQPAMDHINSIQDKNQITGLVAHLHAHGIDALFGFGSGADFKNAKEVIGQADQAGLSLPDRDYYLKDDAKSVELRKGYVEHVTNMFKLLGDSPEKTAAEANAVMSIETALAKGSMDRVERREPSKIYHKLTEQDWQALTPSISWPKYLTEVGAPSLTSLNVAVPDFFKALDVELKTVSLDDLKVYFRWHLIHGLARSLPKGFVDENFNFYGKTLTGAKELRPRWKRCTSAVDGDLGEALGQVFVEKHFPPEAKARTLKMVGEVEEALRQDIQGLDWMTPATKKQAIVKLQAIQNKIGYPNKWRDYSTLNIVRGDALGNLLRANEFGVRYELNKIGKPLDKGEWQMTPPTVNAL